MPKKRAVLTDRETKVLNILMNYATVKNAVPALKMSEQTIYNILYRLRKKQRKARRLINVLLGYRRKSPLLNKVLAPRLSPEEEDRWLEA